VAYDPRPGIPPPEWAQDWPYSSAAGAVDGPALDPAPAHCRKTNPAGPKRRRRTGPRPSPTDRKGPKGATNI